MKKIEKIEEGIKSDVVIIMERKIQGEDIPIETGIIERKTKTMIVISVGVKEERYTVDGYSNFYKPTSRHYRGPLNGTYLSLPVQSDDIPGLIQQVYLNKEAAKSKKAAVVAEKKAKADKKEADYRAAIAKFWNDEGEEIWRKRREMVICGLTLTVIERMGAKAVPNKSWGRESQAAFLQIGTRKDMMDWNYKDEGREQREVIHVERGGIKVHDQNDDRPDYPSFWSGSCRTIKMISNWQAELVYDELGD